MIGTRLGPYVVVAADKIEVMAYIKRIHLAT